MFQSLLRKRHSAKSFTWSSNLDAELDQRRQALESKQTTNLNLSEEERRIVLSVLKDQFLQRAEQRYDTAMAIPDIAKSEELVPIIKALKINELYYESDALHKISLFGKYFVACDPKNKNQRAAVQEALIKVPLGKAVVPRS